MRELGFVAALVLILCCITYFSRQTFVSVPSDANSKYAPAIKAAENAKQIADAETRRRWILSLQLTAAQSAENPVYTTEGESSEILVVTSNSADSAFCSAFANGEQGAAAASIGFNEVSCRNRSTGGVYNAPISASR
jgi:hypothetical protein